MTRMIFVSLPVTDLQASIAFCNALGFQQNLLVGSSLHGPGGDSAL